MRLAPVVLALACACGGRILEENVGTTNNGPHNAVPSPDPNDDDAGAPAPPPIDATPLCKYTCAGGVPGCVHTCKAPQAPGVAPFECCSGGSCTAPTELPPGVSATCVSCPQGWHADPKDVYGCCITAASGASGCFSLATERMDIASGFASSGCSTSSGGCTCSMSSMDGHHYERSCVNGTCACRYDGVVTSTFLATSSSCATLPGDWQRWQCGYPPF